MTTQLFDEMFPIQSARNCLKRATGRFHRSKSKTDVGTERASKKEEEERRHRYRQK
jgi:hypothetical protein